MNLDDIHPVDDLSEITVRAAVDRLRRSTTHEQFIFREIELDEMWRIVDLALQNPQCAANAGPLANIRAAIMAAHDLVGVDLRPAEAAAALEAALPKVIGLR